MGATRLGVIVFFPNVQFGERFGTCRIFQITGVVGRILFLLGDTWKESSTAVAVAVHLDHQLELTP